LDITAVGIQTVDHNVDFIVFEEAPVLC
jgi:hypothetical protein